MQIVVQKFGGTSVGSADGLRSLVEIVRESRKARFVAVVVSAISSRTKAEGTTSLLLEACRRAVAGESFEPQLANIRAQHVALIDESIGTPATEKSLLAFIDERLAWATSFLGALRVIGDLSPRSHDAVVSLGEQLSAHLVAAALREGGIPAEPRELDRCVTAESDELDARFYERLSSNIAERCAPRSELVPVLTGFFGPVPGGLLKRIGRGYSDLTAALLAKGLGNERTEELQIWKEVDGVFSADPRRVPSAKVVPVLSAQEAAELTGFGSEVIHPYTMEQVTAAGIPIRVKNTLAPSRPGTLIVPSLTRDEKSATAVTAKRGVTVCSITSNKMYEAAGFLARVFGVVRDLDLSVDLISTSEVSISFTVDDSATLERAQIGLEELGTTSVLRQRAILSVVGEGLNGYAGAAGKLFSALGAKGVNIEMISQGVGQTNISCVIREEDLESALLTAHHTFFEES